MEARRNTKCKIRSDHAMIVNCAAASGRNGNTGRDLKFRSQRRINHTHQPSPEASRDSGQAVDHITRYIRFIITRSSSRESVSGCATSRHGCSAKSAERNLIPRAPTLSFPRLAPVSNRANSRVREFALKSEVSRLFRVAIIV